MLIISVMKKGRPTQSARRFDWLLVGLTLFVVTMFLAISNRLIEGWERTVLLGVYHFPHFLLWPMLALTQLGSAWMVYGLTLGLALVHRYRLAVRVLLAGFSAYVLTEVLKQLIARPRPALVVAGVVQHESGLTGYGFPSGHAAVATAVSLKLLPFLPKRWRWLPIG